MYTLKKLSRLELVIDFPKLKLVNDHICDSCRLGKKTRTSFRVKNIVSTSKPLQLFHIDLFGPTRTASIGSKRYALVIVDDYSSFTWVVFLTNNYEDFDNFEVFCRKVQRDAGYFISTIHSDHK